MILWYSKLAYNSKLFQARTGGVYNKANARMYLKQRNLTNLGHVNLRWAEAKHLCVTHS